MELEQTQTNQKVEKTPGQAEPARINVLHIPDLTFKQIWNPPTQLYSHETLPEVRYQQNMDSYAIRAIRKNHLLLYKIKDKKIELVSNHTLSFPPTLKFGPKGFHPREISQRAVRYYEWPTSTNARQVTPNSFINLQFNPYRYKNQPIFEFKYGAGQPKIIKPDSFSPENSSYKYAGFVYLRYSDFSYLGGWKPSLDPNLCLMSLSRAKDRNLDYIPFLAKDWNQDLPQRIFQFKKSFKDSPTFKEKLVQDSMIFTELGEEDDPFRRFRFSADSLFYFQTDLANPKQNIFPVILIEQKMITVQLFNQRSRKAVANRFFSIFELLKHFNMTKVRGNVNHWSCKIDKAIYSMAMDTLILSTKIDGSERQQNRFARMLEENFRITVINLFRSGLRHIRDEQITIDRRKTLQITPTGYADYQISGKKLTLTKYSLSKKKEEQEVSLDVIDTQEPPLPYWIEKKTFDIERSVLGESHKIKQIRYLKDMTLLVISDEEFRLIDIETGKLLSHVGFNLNIFGEKRHHQILGFEKDLLVTPSQYGKELRFFKLDLKENYFKPVFSHDITKLYDLGSKVELLDLAKFSGDFYEMLLIVMDFRYQSKRQHILSSRFWISTEKNITPEELKFDSILKEEIDFGEIKIFRKWGITHFFMFEESRLRFYHLQTLAEGGESRRKFQKYRYKNKILDAHVLGDKLYLVVINDEGGSEKREEQIRIDRCQVKDIKLGGFVSQKRLENSYDVKGKSGKVFFDEVTKEFRIFVFGNAQVNKQSVKEPINLKILDSGLNVISELSLKGIEEVQVLKVIDSHKIFIGAINTSTSKKVGLLLNLQKRTAKKLAYESGEPVSVQPNLCRDRRLLCFQRTLKSTRWSEHNILRCGSGAIRVKSKSETLDNNIEDAFMTDLM